MTCSATDENIHVRIFLQPHSLNIWQRCLILIKKGRKNGSKQATVIEQLQHVSLFRILLTER